MLLHVLLNYVPYTFLKKRYSTSYTIKYSEFKVHQLEFISM